MGPNIVMGAFSMPVDVVGATQVNFNVNLNKMDCQFKVVTFSDSHGVWTPCLLSDFSCNHHH